MNSVSISQPASPKSDFHSIKSPNCDRLILTLFVTLCITSFSGAQGFLRAVGTKIFNRSNEEIILKGIGIGGWLVPEGYMLQTSSFANSPSEIRYSFASLVGDSATDQFFDQYRKNFVTRKDVDRIAGWGFNSIRLPMHYALLTPKDEPGVYLESGFAIIDSLLDWCAADSLYLILDLHCAPGGQNNINISDYAGYPSLWESTQNQQRTVELWKTIAARYVNKRWIGGYDLLNEPAWSLGSGNTPLRSLYASITQAIREVDVNHLLFIEGNWYATDFSGLTPPWDGNMAYSFHKYWNPNNASSIGGYLDLRTNNNVPLWMGESGENSNSWFTDCVELLERNDIGWSWWTYKKIESTNPLMSVRKTQQYDYLLKYWNGQVSAPTRSYAIAALNGMAAELRIDSCNERSDVIDALFRQPFQTSSLPYSSNDIPGVIYADNYDMGKQGNAYGDADYQNVGGAGNGNWNIGGFYRNDGVDIELCVDPTSNGYDVGWINDGEFLAYTVNIKRTDAYFIDARISSSSSGSKITLYVDGQDLKSAINIPSTGGLGLWKSVRVGPETLTVGVHNLAILFLGGGFNLSSLKFTSLSVAIGSYQVYQNYPNPFNPSTTIEYDTPRDGRVSIEIYDILGRKVANVDQGDLTAGRHSANIDAGMLRLASGAYFYRSAMSGSKSNVRKLVVIK